MTGLAEATAPRPSGAYDPWTPPGELDEFQESLVLGAYPPGSRIVAERSYRPGYMRYPLRVTLGIPDGSQGTCVLKIDPGIGVVEKEARLLPVLARLGLAVPRVLAGPAAHPEYPNAGLMVVLSELPGEPLPWLEATLAGADLTCRLLEEAVDRLHALTDPVRREAIARELPENSVAAESGSIAAAESPWVRTELFQTVLSRLRPIVARIDTPLVFSNSDYNPLNFLYTGESVTGWLDFAGACFEDPHIGYARFLVLGFDSYGWGTGVKSGLVERHLYTHNMTRRDFAPRLAVRCLWRLQRDISVTGEQDAGARAAVLGLLQSALSDL